MPGARRLTGWLKRGTGGPGRDTGGRVRGASGVPGASAVRAALGASMSVGYVAVYEEGGNSTPTATPAATGQVTGINGLCLSNSGGLNTEGNPMRVAGCAGSPGQEWSPYSDGTLRTEGGCLDVVSAGTTSGTYVDWYPCNGTPAQDWTHQSDGELVNPSSGLCLTDPGGNTSARLDIETCTDSAQQQWTPPAAGNGAGVTITASDYTAANSVGTEPTSDAGGGDDVGWINSASWLEYAGVDFGSGDPVPDRFRDGDPVRHDHRQRDGRLAGLGHQHGDRGAGAERDADAVRHLQHQHRRELRERELVPVQLAPASSGGGTGRRSPVVRIKVF